MVTSLPGSEFGARALYEDLCCARGDMENRSRKQQLELFLSAFAGILIRTVRALLLKIACRVTASVRRIRLSLSSVHPHRQLFAQSVAAMRAAAAARASP